MQFSLHLSFYHEHRGGRGGPSRPPPHLRGRFPRTSAARGGGPEPRGYVRRRGRSGGGLQDAGRALQQQQRDVHPHARLQDLLPGRRAGRSRPGSDQLSRTGTANWRCRCAERGRTRTRALHIHFRFHSQLKCRLKEGFAAPGSSKAGFGRDRPSLPSNCSLFPGRASASERMGLV